MAKYVGYPLLWIRETSQIKKTASVNLWKPE